MDKFIASLGNLYNKLRSCCKSQQQSAGTHQPLIIASKPQKKVHFDETAVDNRGKTTREYRNNPTYPKGTQAETTEETTEERTQRMQTLIAIQHQVHRHNNNNTQG